MAAFTVTTLLDDANTFQAGYGVLIIVDSDTQVAIFGETLASMQPTDFAFS